MEKPLGYSPSPEQDKIKKEPEPLIKRVVGNISRRLQKPEGKSSNPNEKAVGTLPKEIKELAEKRAGKEEANGFGDFLADKLNKPIDRRTALKIALGTAVGLISADYAINNIDRLWNEYSEKRTDEAIRESKELQSSINLLNKVAEYPEMIEKSEKQSLEEFAKNLSEKDFNNLIIGELHGFGPTLEKAAYFLEELIKRGKKISAICLEGVSYTDPRHVEIIRKINTKEVPLEEMSDIVGPIELIKLAKKYSIEIIGLEKGAPGADRPDEYGRFREMSERIGEISKDRTKEGIVVAEVGQAHVTTDSWENYNLLIQLAGETNYLPSREEALENNYTIKEYLEKINFKPVAIQIEDWEKSTGKVDSSLAGGADRLPLNDKKIFYEIAKNKWQSYRLKEKEDFVVPYPKGKENTYSMIIPSEIPEKPPKLSEKMGDN